MNRQSGEYCLCLRRARGVALIAAGLAFAGLAAIASAGEPERLVHRFLAIAVSPDGSAVGAVPVARFILSGVAVEMR